MAAVEAEGRSTGELVRDLSRQVSTLARQEIELAKAEMIEKSRAMGLGAGLLAGAAVAAVLGLGALTACVVLALDGAMPAWLAALLAALAWAAVAGGLTWIGKQKLEQAGAPVPEETVESVKEDIRWLKDQTR